LEHQRTRRRRRRDEKGGRAAESIARKDVRSVTSAGVEGVVVATGSEPFQRRLSGRRCYLEEFLAHRALEAFTRSHRFAIKATASISMRGGVQRKPFAVNANGKAPSRWA
jgi:hypothetical protein